MEQLELDSVFGQSKGVYRGRFLILVTSAERTGTTLLARL